MDELTKEKMLEIIDYDYFLYYQQMMDGRISIKEWKEIKKCLIEIENIINKK